MYKVILVLALFGSAFSFSMPSFGGNGGMPSFGSFGGKGSSEDKGGMPSFGSMGNKIKSNVNSQMADAEKGMKCVMSSCSSQISACDADSDCKSTEQCVQNCNQEYENNEKEQDYCKSSCASDMEDNTAFQNLANCSGKCMESAGVMPFTCLSGKCSSQWSSCQANKSCAKAIACSNTCFGDEDCMKDCAEKIPGQLASSLFSCVGECMMGSL